MPASMWQSKDKEKEEKGKESSNIRRKKDH